MQNPYMTNAENPYVTNAEAQVRRCSNALGPHKPSHERIACSANLRPQLTVPHEFPSFLFWILSCLPLLPTLLRSFILLLPPGLDSTPTARSTARKRPKKVPGRATNKGARETKACAQATEKLGAEPYGVTWATRKLNTMLNHRYSEI